MATCLYAGCAIEFTPTRPNQKFHQPACKAAYWHEHRRGDIHKCPLCGAAHDPEERDVLNALELAVKAIVTPETAAVWAEVEAFIHRRRDMLAG